MPCHFLTEPVSRLTNKLPSRPWLLLPMMALSWPVWGQAEDEWRQAVSVGAYYARGDYGEPLDTSIYYYPVSYEASKGKWGFQLTVPYLEVSGPGNVLINIGGVTQSLASDEVSQSGGPGDTVASLIYRFDPWSARAPFVDLRVDVKIPTADEVKALGTGEPDTSVQLDFSQAVGDAALFATAGYNWRGKTTLYAGLQNGFFGQLGFSKPITEAVQAGAFYDYRQAASDFAHESHELVPYISWQLDKNWSFTGLSILGFTEASAEVSVMGQLRYSW